MNSRIETWYYRAVVLSAIIPQLTDILMSKGTAAFLQPQQIRNLNNCHTQLLCQDSEAHKFLGVAFSLAAAHCRGEADNADKIEAEIRTASAICQAELQGYKRKIIELAEVL